MLHHPVLSIPGLSFAPPYRLKTSAVGNSVQFQITALSPPAVFQRTFLIKRKITIKILSSMLRKPFCFQFHPGPEPGLESGSQYTTCLLKHYKGPGASQAVASEWEFWILITSLLKRCFKHLKIHWPLSQLLLHCTQLAAFPGCASALLWGSSLALHNASITYIK